MNVLFTFILHHHSHVKETTTHGQIVKFVNWYWYQAFNTVFSEIVISQSLQSPYKELHHHHNSPVRESIFLGVIDTTLQLAVITSAREIFELSNSSVEIMILSVQSSIT